MRGITHGPARASSRRYAIETLNRPSKLPEGVFARWPRQGSRPTSSRAARSQDTDDCRRYSGPATPAGPRGGNVVSSRAGARRVSQVDRHRPVRRVTFRADCDGDPLDPSPFDQVFHLMFSAMEASIAILRVEHEAFEVAKSIVEELAYLSVGGCLSLGIAPFVFLTDCRR